MGKTVTYSGGSFQITNEDGSSRAVAWPIPSSSTGASLPTGTGLVRVLSSTAEDPVTITGPDTDGTLAANSDTVLPSQKAVKTIVTTKVTANNAITGATKTKITYDSKGLV